MTFVAITTMSVAMASMTRLTTVTSWGLADSVVAMAICLVVPVGVTHEEVTAQFMKRVRSDQRDSLSCMNRASRIS